jgi:hypothetical protein
MLVLGTPRFPNHGVQLITVLISTKSYHEAALTLRDDDYEGDPLGERSHVLPWSLATLTSAADVNHYLTSLMGDRTEAVASQLIDYISSEAITDRSTMESSRPNTPDSRQKGRDRLRGWVQQRNVLGLVFPSVKP